MASYRLAQKLDGENWEWNMHKILASKTFDTLWAS